MPKRKNQDGGSFGILGDLFGFGSPEQLGITPAQYRRAIAHHQKGGDFMSYVNKIKSAGKKAYKAVEAALPVAQQIAQAAIPVAQAANNAVEHKHQKKVKKGLDWMQKLAGAGVEGDHKYYGVTRAHYNKALRKHLQHGGSFWDTIKSVGSVAKDVAKVAVPVAKMGTQFLPEKYRGAANTGLDITGQIVGSGQEGGFFGPMLASIAAPMVGKMLGLGFKKGSPEAKAHMAKLRAMRKKKAP